MNVQVVLANGRISTPVLSNKTTNETQVEAKVPLLTGSQDRLEVQENNQIGHPLFNIFSQADKIKEEGNGEKQISLLKKNNESNPV